MFASFNSWENSSASRGGNITSENDEVDGVLSCEQWVVKNMEVQQYVPSFMMDDESEKIGDLMEEILFHHKCYNCDKFLGTYFMKWIVGGRS